MPNVNILDFTVFTVCVYFHRAKWSSVLPVLAPSLDLEDDFTLPSLSSNLNILSLLLTLS